MPNQADLSCPRLSRRWLLLAAFALLWFGVLGIRHLVPTDEGRYAEIPREMLLRADWVTPRLDGFRYFEKPPLQYWATAATYAVFGFGEWQARLWSGLCGFLTVVFTAYAGRRIWGPRTGLFGAAMLGSCLYWIALGHINTLDMGVSALLGSSLLSFALAQRDDAAPSQTRNWMLLCWSLMGLALLSKGLIGLLFPGATLVLYSALQRDAAMWRRLHLVKGCALMLAIAVPWHLLAQARNPDFFHFYFIVQQFERFLTPALQRPGPWYYFVPILLLGTLPWTGALLPALLHGLRCPLPHPELAPARPGPRLAANRLLLIWVVLIFVFFSVSHSKLPSYILPLFPALALLLGDQLARARSLRWTLLLPALLALPALPALTQLSRVASPSTPLPLLQQYGHWLWPALLLLLLGSVGGWWLERQGRRCAAVLALSACALLAWTLATQAFQILGRTASSRDVVTAIRPWLHPGQAFYDVGGYDQTLPFYLDRTTTVVDYKGELEYGIGHDPQLWIPDIQSFAARWNHDRLPLALMEPGQLPRLQAIGLPLRVIYRSRRFTVIARPDQDYGPLTSNPATSAQP